MAATTASSRQRQLFADEPFWHRFSPHHELPLSTVSSFSLHGLIVGLLILIALLGFKLHGDAGGRMPSAPSFWRAAAAIPKGSTTVPVSVPPAAMEPWTNSRRKQPIPSGWASRCATSCWKCGRRPSIFLSSRIVVASFRKAVRL